jgi:hypothetical protein
MTSNPADERMHPVGDAPAWSESYYFNFVDPDSEIAMFTRMGFRPGNGWADGLHAVYLGGDRVAFTYGRRDIGTDLSVYDDDLAAGQLRLTCVEPFQHWRVAYDGPAQDIADAAVLMERSKLRPDGWYRPAELSMEVDFRVISAPHYAYSDASDASDATEERTRGHFEQTGSVAGEIRIGEESYTVSGFGVRDKSWGPRDWGAGSGGGGASTGPAPSTPGSPAPFVNWFSMNFGADMALGGSCGRGADGVMRGAGWLYRDGATQDLVEVTIESDYRPDSILHRAVRFQARAADGEPLQIDGEVLSVCPTKIPMPGGATFVNEGLVRFGCAGMTGYGISEHWHAVRIGDASA